MTEFLAQGLSGRASPEFTSAYFERLQGQFPAYRDKNWFCHPKRLKGLAVSRLAFAASSLQPDRPHAKRALREALLGGINTISVPWDGGGGGNDRDGNTRASARFCFQVLYELQQAHRLRREEIVFVSSLGYFSEPPHRGSYLRFSDNLYYSIDTDFLEDELTQLLHWLGTDCLDVLLLTHPEVFYREFSSIDRAQAVEQLSVFLRQEQARGRIQFFGFCSSVLAHPSEDFLELNFPRLQEDFSDLAVLQFPANFLESEFRFNRRSAGGLLSEQLRRGGFWSLSYRPFKAIEYPGLRLLYLVGHPEPSADGGASIAAELNRSFARLKEQENSVVRLFSDRHFAFSDRTPAPSGYLRMFRDVFWEPNAFGRALQEIRKDLQKTYNHLRLLERNPEEHYAVEHLRGLCNSFLLHWHLHIREVWQKHVSKWEEHLSLVDPAYQKQPMSRAGLLYLLAAVVPETVLVNFRDYKQVREVLGVFSLPLPQKSNLAASVRAFEEALSFTRSLIEEDIAAE